MQRSDSDVVMMELDKNAPIDLEASDAEGFPDTVVDETPNKLLTFQARFSVEIVNHPILE